MQKLTFKTSFLLGLLFIMVLMLPYLILGQDAFINFHDFLDSNPVHVRSIISLGLIGNPDGMLPVLDGGVRSTSYVSLIPIDIKTILYMLLPLYWAIVLNVVFVRLMAFIGMFLLCVRYITKDNYFLSLLVSILFCIVPFYADYGLSAAGVPLLLYAVLNLENKRKLLLSYVLIAFFTCNSSLSLVGLFVCFLWVAWIIIKWYKERAIPKYHIYGLLIMIVIYLFANITIIYDYFFPSNSISHRVEFANTSTLISYVIDVIKIMLISQTHAGVFIAAIVVGLSLIIFIKHWREDQQIKYYCYLYLVVVGLILIGKLIRFIPLSIFQSLQLDRFYFLFPALCFIILAKAFSLISQKKVLIVIMSCAIAMGTICFDREFRTNALSICGITLSRTPSFNQFFDEPLFAQIKDDMGGSESFQTKVVSVGMYPSVAEYNGFYTLDSYVLSYSLDYKHIFRKVIEGELAKSMTLQKTFDNWGSRCYVFSAELGTDFLYGKSESKQIKELTINTEELKKLGCEYVFSAAEICNYSVLNLDFIDNYTSEKSYWKIWVYRIK